MTVAPTAATAGKSRCLLNEREKLSKFVAKLTTNLSHVSLQPLYDLGDVNIRSFR